MRPNITRFKLLTTNGTLFHHLNLLSLLGVNPEHMLVHRVRQDLLVANSALNLASFLSLGRRMVAKHMSFQRILLHDSLAVLAFDLQKMSLAVGNVLMPIKVMLFKVICVDQLITDKAIDRISDHFVLMLASDVSFQGSWVEFLAANFTTWLDFVDVECVSLLLVVKNDLVADIAFMLIVAYDCLISLGFVQIFHGGKLGLSVSCWRFIDTTVCNLLISLGGC